MIEEKKVDDQPVVPEGQDSSPAGNDPKPGAKGQENDVSGLLAKRNELLKENKAVKAKLKKFEEQQAALEKAELEKQGKYQELLEKMTAEQKKIKDDLQKEKKKNIASGLKVKENYIEFVQDKIELDEDMNPTNLDDLSEQLKSQYPEILITSDQEKRPQQTAGLPAKTQTKYNTPMEELMSLTGEAYEKRAPALMDEIAKTLGVKK